MRHIHLRTAFRLAPLVGLLAFAAFAGFGGAMDDANAAHGTTGTHGAGSCTGLFACGGNTGTIGANSCNGVGACDGNTDTIGDNSCNGNAACFDNTGTIGANSCNGDSACYFNGASGGTGTVGDGSCNGAQACYGNGVGGTGTVGDGSCNGTNACYFNGLSGTGAVGGGSCNGYAACPQNGTLGTGTVGVGSCNGDNACYVNGYLGAGSVGDYSCNGGGQCPAATTDLPGVGDCEENLPGFVPAICLGPIVHVTYTDESTGGPYVPGTWTRGPVVVRFTCTSFLSTIPPGAAHNDTGPSGAGNTYPASVRVTRTTLLALSSRWRCMDIDGNLADAPAGFPADIRIDRKAPSCTVAVSRTSVPRSGAPTAVTATVNGTDADSGVATRKIIAISPAPLSGDALPDNSPGTWTLVGASGRVFTFTGEVRDNAGNVKTCTKKVVLR